MALSRSIEKVFLFSTLLVAAVGCGSTSPLSPDGGATGKTNRGGGGDADATSQGTAGASHISGSGGAGASAIGTAGARGDGGAGTGATCAWPASLDTPDAGAGACRPAHDLLSCGDELCLSNDPTQCPEENSVTTPMSDCHDLCGAQEFAVVCGSVGPGPISDPPAGCHGELATPGGIVFYCCPCVDSGGGHDGGGTDAIAAGRVPQAHRASDAQCVGVAPAGATYCPSLASAFASDCQTDSQCTSGVSGRCESNGGGPAGCHCSYDTCTHDNVCKGGPCACHGSAHLSGGNVCAPGNCQVDSDCGAGGFCSPSLSPTSCYSLAGYYCHTRGDQCVDDTDCGAGNGESCMYDVGAQRWQCQQTNISSCAI
jgi:hypothetical protein